MQEKNLNLIPSGDMPVIYASQYDKNRVIRFNLFEGEDEYTLSGTEIVKCNIRKNDEHIVIITPVIGANKYIDIYLTEQACACFGSNIGEITISSDEDTLIGTINFILEVERNPIQGGVTSASDIADLETQIEEIVHEVMSDDYYTRDEVDAKLDLKANATDVYTKSQVDTALGLKADKADTYTKSQVDTALALKADASSVYTKAEVDTALALKANATDVYTKTEVDEMIEELYPVNSASGAIANFTTSLIKPLVGLSSTIVAQQAGTGTPSPSNPRPISGFSSVRLCQAFGISEDTITIALGQTVYGGVVDIKNGTATITHVCEELDSLTWGLGSGGSARFVANPTYNAKAPTTATIQADVISDIFKTVSSRTIYDGTDDYEIAIHTNGTIWVRDTDYSDKDAFKTDMANHYIVYELATPIEITGLTTGNFTTIAGEQNIFSDCGDVEVSFKQGIQEYIDDKLGG